MKHGVLFVIILLILSMGAASAEENKISHSLLSALRDNESIPVIIVMKDQPFITTKADMQAYANKTQKALKEILEKARLESKAGSMESLWIVNAIAVNATPQLIHSIASRDDVASIEPVRKMHIADTLTSTSVAWGVSKINATRVWESGIDGRGISVSVIDTGIAPHPDIAGRVIKWKDYIKNRNSAYDDNGHGTFVAGTVGGNGKDGIETGVAPNVSLFGVKALDSTGSGYETSVIEGVEWSINNSADIISMSLGTEETYNKNCDADDPAMAIAINNSVRAGVVVVAAAGNNASGVSSPGCIKNVIAVGAVDSSDTIAGFSGTGFAMYDHGVVAPGVDITSLDYNSDGYLSHWSGTSMATPHVSGTAALVLQSNPGLTPPQLRQRLESTSIALGDHYIYGAGRIDAYRAVFIFTAGRIIYGTVFNDSNSNGIKDAGESGIAGWTISLSGIAGGKFVHSTATTDSSGNYSFTNLQAGKYTLMERFQLSWIATTPFYCNAAIRNGDAVKCDFGDRRLR